MVKDGSRFPGLSESAIVTRYSLIFSRCKIAPVLRISLEAIIQVYTKIFKRWGFRLLYNGVRTPGPCRIDHFHMHHSQGVIDIFVPGLYSERPFSEGLLVRRTIAPNGHYSDYSEFAPHFYNLLHTYISLSPRFYKYLHVFNFIHIIIISSTLL